MQTLRKRLSRIYYKLLPHPLYNLEKELRGCRSLLDLGCGRDSPIQGILPGGYSVGVELFEPYLAESKEKGIHNDYFLADIRTAEFAPGSFECVLAWDVLEHLTRDEGSRLIQKMEKIARSKVIIFTPNGFVPQEKYDNNEYQQHKAGWDVTSLKKLGYKVRGINGLRFLRKEKAAIRFRPVLFFTIISDLSQIITYFLPRAAFQLLATKRIP